MPDDYFKIRAIMEKAPNPQDRKWGHLVRAACRAIDAYDWPALRRTAKDALELDPCDLWRERIEELLCDPVFRVRAG